MICHSCRKVMGLCSSCEAAKESFARQKAEEIIDTEEAIKALTEKLNKLKGLELVGIHQFEHGNQGVYKCHAQVWCEVHVETTCAPRFGVCASPLKSRAYHWIHFRGERWPVKRDKVRPGWYLISEAGTFSDEDFAAMRSE